jgi:DNA-binding response OmpR family regulator
LILLTIKESRKDIITGLKSGANEFITKPFDAEELHARIRTGMRIIGLQRHSAEQVRQLDDLLARVKQFQGLLPIASEISAFFGFCHLFLRR